MAVPHGPYREPTLQAPVPVARALPVGAAVLGALVVLSSACVGPAGGVFAACCVLVVGVPLTAIHLARGRRARARKVAIEGAVVLAGALIALVVPQPDPAIALRNEAQIIPAVDAYRAEHGHYPESLDELVPRFLRSTRPAGSAGPMRRIQYWRHDDTATLVVTVVPPFGRRTWDFKTRRAANLD